MQDKRSKCETQCVGEGKGTLTGSGGGGYYKGVDNEQIPRGQKGDYRA